jgi:hypothetical protein
MNYDLGFFDTNEIIVSNPTNATCRTCKHRLRFALNDHSKKIVQCCELQPSKRSNSGYKTIKVTNSARIGYEKE